MAIWVKAAREDDFEDVQVIRFVYQENPIAIFKLDDGFYAIDDTCTHAEASLSEGEVYDGVVECPLHGAEFDIRTGKNLTLPAVTPVRSYPVKVEEGDILIQVEE